MFALSGVVKLLQLVRLLMVGGGGGVVSMSNVNFDPCGLSLKVLEKYYFIPLEKGPMTESIVFFRKHTVLNVLAFYLVNVYLT